jgi:CheY-like chemotaxis protein
VARFDPDAIVLDLLMPGMDGFAVLRAVSESGRRRVPVLACTGWRDPELEDRVRAAGFDRVVEKPVKLDHLLAAIRELLDA